MLYYWTISVRMAVELPNNSISSFSSIYIDLTKVNMVLIDDIQTDKNKENLNISKSNDKYILSQDIWKNESSFQHMTCHHQDFFVSAFGSAIGNAPLNKTSQGPRPSVWGL